jgi:DNA (cytosine-5)-methyltransferase 1
MNKQYNIVSIFSGAGGIDSGFERAGFKTVYATDISPECCLSFKENFPSTEVICDDIQNINFISVKKKYKNIDGLVGGPPCPSFSKSRFYIKDKKRGIQDSVGFLTLSNYFRAVKELKPKFFFLENVHGFVYKPHKSALEYVKKNSKKLGYKLFFSVVNAADFGVAQIRERFICIGLKTHLSDFNFPKETHSSPDKKINNLKKWVTCGDILNDIDFKLKDDKLLEAGSKDKDLLKLVPPGDNYLFFTKERGHAKPLFKWRSRYWSFLLKLSPKKPSWTIQASHSNNMGPFHWKNRFLRIQEIKRIQSFDDNYKISGNFRSQWRQIGNAVPPLLSYKFALELKRQCF